MKMALKEYKPGTAFSGVIGRTFDVSQPAWPQPLRPKDGAPKGAPVTPKYKPPFPFTGKIYKVTVDVSGELIHDHEAELRRHLARQ
jgi:hypothetical protein